MTEIHRGRPLGFDPDQTLHQLMLLFWEHGYDATTQSDMVARTGLSSSSLYNTFGDKPAIFDRVLERYNAMTVTGCEPLMTGTDGLAELEALVERVHEHVAQPEDMPAGCLITASMGELAGREPDISPRADEYRNIMREAFAVAIDRAVALGDLEPGDTAARSALLLAAYLGTLTTDKSSADPADAIAMVEGMRQLLESWHPR